MHAAAHALRAEQHHAEKRGLEEKGGQHFVAEQRAQDVAGGGGELAPVRAELEAHHEPRHDAETERDREDLQPESVEGLIGGLAGAQPQELEHDEPARKSDRERGEQNVERNREPELDAREQQGGGHAPILVHNGVRAPAETRAYFPRAPIFLGFVMPK